MFPIFKDKLYSIYQDRDTLFLETQVSLEDWARIGGVRFEYPVASECVLDGIVCLEEVYNGKYAFNATPYVVRTFNEKMMMQDLRTLYKIYYQIPFENEMRVHNVYLQQLKLKVLDLGLGQRVQSQVKSLAHLIFKLHMPAEHRMLKYMSPEQMRLFLYNKLSDHTLIDMLTSETLSWDSLGDILFTIKRSSSNPRSATTVSCSSYSIALQTIQNNIKSRSGKNLQSTSLSNSISKQPAFRSSKREIVRKRPYRTQLDDSNSISVNQTFDFHNDKDQEDRNINQILQKAEQIKNEFQIKMNSNDTQVYVNKPNINDKIQIEPAKTIENTSPSKQKIKQSTQFEYIQDVSKQMEQIDSNLNTLNHRRRIPTPPRRPRSGHKDVGFKRPHISFNIDEAQDIDTIILDNHEHVEYATKYRQALKNINIAGTMVGQCITAMDAYKNLWIMPLFIIFKRVHQMRTQIETDFKQGLNMWNLHDFQAFLKSDYASKLNDEIHNDNQIVASELNIILNKAIPKLDKLDLHSRQKIEPLINTDLTISLREIAFVYLYSQILPKIRFMVKNSECPNELLEQVLTYHIQDQIFQSLLIIDQGPYKIQLDKDNIEQRVELLKQRIIQKGYQL